MSTQHPVRRLTGTVSRQLSGPVRYNPFWGGVDAAGAVVDVSATELLLTEEDIASQLRRHQLRSTDLVRFDGCWVSLTEFPPLAEEAAVAEQYERRVRFAKYAALMFVCLCALFIRFAIRFS